MYTIKGYRIKKVSFRKVEDVLDEAKKSVKRIAHNRYCELLSREIENLIDHIVLGNINQPKEKSIFDSAVEELNKKIASAMARRDNNEYNLACSVNLLSYKNDTYIELCAITDIYDTVFLNIDGVEDYCVEESNSLFAMVDEKIEIWKAIIEKYKHDTVFSMRLYPVANNTRPKFEELHFNSIDVRAEAKARHYVSNVLLAGYSCGEQIPPYKLMELMDYALLRSSDANIAPSIKTKAEELKRILPEITEEMIIN